MKARDLLPGTLFQFTEFAGNSIVFVWQPAHVRPEYHDAEVVIVEPDGIGGYRPVKERAS